MSRGALPPVLAEILSLPTAPFAEAAVLDHVARVTARLAGVTTRRDPHGNLLAHYCNGVRKRNAPILTAHADHPGFVALRMSGPRRLRAAFRGWVEPLYFQDTAVAFWTGGRWVRGRVERITKVARLRGAAGRTARPEEVLIAVRGPVEPGSPGMWDLPGARLRGGLVRSRACDDLAGCAAIVALLARLSRRRARAEAYCLFTRAEEVGFVGAVAAARAGTIPRGAPVIAIETSKALPHAPIGAGPILRVGDRASVFTPSVTAFCERVARSLSQRKRSFAFQRRLMDGGTCESTAYLAYGYPTTGVCVALGNYHNMDVRRGRIASEYVSLSDWLNMVDWFEAIALDESGWDDEPGDLRRTIDERFDKLEPLLER